jgi:hypothetical protein
MSNLDSNDVKVPCIMDDHPLVGWGAGCEVVIVAAEAVLGLLGLDGTEGVLFVVVVAVTVAVAVVTGGGSCGGGLGEDIMNYRIS